ncbi:YiiX/YebB-like N1pC/P60 family cysteine hydrolase [Acidovorax sp. sic0104]|uniref:YiiX/YebB-like N1pC/P60 family cysteine hydrolase n=1 Tax=Acidovorax sp. sic0104 TaxID=2854784 RepID=UPI001C44A992|nr:YiiX/YebB-like N1pC/P60 family cysteine hydrolase [Acidovorax sp. sic0104]MBV7542042.1 hypothetical protein [Acidovorax sp. sic0104]
MDYPLPGYRATLIKQADVCAGDVLLGYAEITSGEDQAQPLGYSHVAIALAEQRVLEATTSGVAIVTMEKLLEDYEHLAVLRSPGLWGAERVQRLEHFARSQSGKPFNTQGMGRVPDRKEKHSADLMEKVPKFFDGTYTPPPPDQRSYFCSQLVVAAFIDADCISDAGSIALSPKVISPSDIGEDKTFGFFVGYVTRSDRYEVPLQDHFRRFL